MASVPESSASRAQTSAKPGLCSTYSTRTPSGPRRKTANVFAASLTSSISRPAPSASSWTPCASSTSSARWFRSGRPPSAALPRDHAHVPVADRHGPVRRGARSRAPRSSSTAASGSSQRQHDVVEVEVAPLALDEPERQAGGRLEGAPRRRPAAATSNGSEPSRRVEVAHAQDHALERAALARALGVEQGQLAELGVDSDEREGVGLLDHVHAEVLAQEGRERLALVHPERHVVQAGGGEVRRASHRSTPRTALPIATTSSCDSSIVGGGDVLLQVLDRRGARESAASPASAPAARRARSGRAWRRARARSGRAARRARASRPVASGNHGMKPMPAASQASSTSSESRSSRL